MHTSSVLDTKAIINSLLYQLLKELIDRPQIMFIRDGKAVDRHLFYDFSWLEEDKDFEHKCQMFKDIVRMIDNRITIYCILDNLSCLVGSDIPESAVAQTNKEYDSLCSMMFGLTEFETSVKFKLLLTERHGDEDNRELNTRIAIDHLSRYGKELGPVPPDMPVGLNAATVEKIVKI